MSYCVNCGVELDATLKKCPLCETKVYHPDKEESPATEQTFPKKKGEVEEVSQKEGIIFVSVLLLTIAVTCTLLNILVYNSNRWSVPVIGICITLWVFFMAAVFSNKITIYGMLLADAVAIGNCIFMVSLITENNRWYYQIGLPIVIVLFGLLEISVFVCKRCKVALLAGTICFFVITAGLCMTTELALDWYFNQVVALSWSAIVLTACAIIVVFLILILMMGRLRNNIRRRLHF